MDLASEEADAGSEDHLQMFVAGEFFDEGWNCVEGGREVCIPETNEGGLKVVDGPDHTEPDRFCLAVIQVEVEAEEAPGVGGAKLVEHGEGSVGAAVIDEKEADFMVGIEEVDEFCGGQACRFVVAGDDDAGLNRGRVGIGGFFRHGRLAVSPLRANGMMVQDLESQIHARVGVGPGIEGADQGVWGM